MKIGQIYSHLNGLEFLQVHKKEIYKEILKTIKNINAKDALEKISKEKNRIGQVLYSARKLNDLFKEELTTYGWEEKRVDYFVTKDLSTTRESILIKDPQAQKDFIEKAEFKAFKTYNQVDFVKDKVAIEIQFGKYFAVQYDLHVKHTFFYERGDIDVGIEIIPMHSMMKKMPSGSAWYENELTNIVREGRSNPSTPIILIGIEP